LKYKRYEEQNVLLLKQPSLLISCQKMEFRFVSVIDKREYSSNMTAAIAKISGAHAHVTITWKTQVKFSPAKIRAQSQVFLKPDA
jgi:hypothetical protein